MPPKRPGRPALEAGKPSVTIGLRVGETDYDRAFAIATRQRESVPDVLRRALRRLISDERGGALP